LCGVEDDLAVGTRRNAGQGGEIDGRGHHKALGVIGVLADQVDASGRGKNGRLGSEAVAVQGAKFVRIVHRLSNLNGREIDMLGPAKEPAGYCGTDLLSNENVFFRDAKNRSS
jgi:hypothetical protein